MVAPWDNRAPLYYREGNLMRSLTKSILAGVIAVCMLLPLGACSKGNDQSDIARAVCESFCTDVKNGDADKLMTYLSSVDFSAAELKEIIEPSGLNSEQAAFSQAVRSSLNYKVQDPVYDPKAKTATVYLSWERADYNCEAALKADTVADFKTAITTAPASIITVCVTVDLKGDTPVIVNPRDVIDAVYSYNTEDHGIMPGVLSDFYQNGELIKASKETYTNVKELGIKVNFKKELSSFRFVPGFTYTVARGSDVLYTSDIIRITKDNYIFTYSAANAGPGGLNEDGFLPAGKYDFMVFDEHSNQITGFECEVLNEPVAKDVIEFEDYDKEHYVSESVYEFKDNDLKAEAFVSSSGWWDYDGTSIGKSAFGSNTKVIGFSLAVGRDNESELFYEYYYSEESDFGDFSEMKPVFQSSCKPTVYKDQACYDLDYSGAVKPGYYALVVYDYSARKHIVLTAACVVVEETSDEMFAQ